MKVKEKVCDRVFLRVSHFSIGHLQLIYVKISYSLKIYVGAACIQVRSVVQKIRQLLSDSSYQCDMRQNSDASI